jgi:hypothetical protein
MAILYQVSWPNLQGGPSAVIGVWQEMVDELERWVVDKLGYGPMLPEEIPWDDYTISPIMSVLRANIFCILGSLTHGIPGHNIHNGVILWSGRQSYAGWDGSQLRSTWRCAQRTGSCKYSCALVGYSASSCSPTVEFFSGDL